VGGAVSGPSSDGKGSVVLPGTEVPDPRGVNRRCNRCGVVRGGAGECPCGCPEFSLTADLPGQSMLPIMGVSREV
jgi:hypothetical protein